MNGHTTTARKYGNLFMTVLFFVFASGTSLAQVPVDEDGNTIPAFYEDDIEVADQAKPAVTEGVVLSPAELEELVGPVALYPDDLLAIVLPASTYPLEIVQAARFLEAYESDSSLKPDEDWDDSIVALLNYPDVVRMMDQDIDWTWRLGDAVISQQTEVIAAVEAFRDRAYAAGNLKTDENQTVTYADDGVIEIAPVNEEIIYVPYYEPEEVVVYQPRRVYHYYPDPYPVYYYPYPLGYDFTWGYFWGVTTAFHIGWSNHYLHVYHPSYWGHPYYGYTYYDYYYRRPSLYSYNTWYVNNNYHYSTYRYRDGDYWRPRTRAGSRQDEPRVRNHHYPPGDDRRDGDRSHDNRRARNQMDSRENGRLPLNLRERSDSDRNRAAVANSSRTGTGVANTSVTNTRRNASADRGTTSTSGTTSNSGRTAATRAPTDNRSNRAVASDNRGRASADNPVRAQNRLQNQNETRSNSPRSEIQFRDRGSDTRGTTARNSARPSQDQSRGRGSQPAPITSSSFVQREAPPARVTAPRTSSRSVTAPGASTPRVVAPSGTSAPRVVAPSRTSAPRVVAPSRTSKPRVVAPSRTSAPRVVAPSRTSKPARTSAPIVSAPSRTSAPRVSAPSRTTAPRVSAPRAQAPQRSAPSGSSRSSGPSRSGASQSRRSSSSRPRSGSN